MISSIFTDCFLADTEYPDHKQYKDQVISFIKKYNRQNKIDEKDFISTHLKYNLAESEP